jgi:hypothetical protein
MSVSVNAVFSARGFGFGFDVRYRGLNLTQLCCFSVLHKLYLSMCSRLFRTKNNRVILFDSAKSEDRTKKRYSDVDRTRTCARERKRFLISLLNHSDTTPFDTSACKVMYINHKYLINWLRFFATEIDILVVLCALPKRVFVRIR